MLEFKLQLVPVMDKADKLKFELQLALRFSAPSASSAFKFFPRIEPFLALPIPLGVNAGSG